MEKIHKGLLEPMDSDLRKQYKNHLNNQDRNILVSMHKSLTNKSKYNIYPIYQQSRKGIDRADIQKYTKLNLSHIPTTNDEISFKQK